MEKGIKTTKKAPKTRGMSSTPPRVIISSSSEAKALAQTLGLRPFDLGNADIRDRYFLTRLGPLYEDARGGLRINVDVDINPEEVHFLLESRTLANEYGTTFGTEYFICPVPKDSAPDGWKASDLPKGRSDDLWDQIRIRVLTKPEFDALQVADVEKLRRRVRDALNKIADSVAIIECARILNVKIS